MRQRNPSWYDLKGTEQSRQISRTTRKAFDDTRHSQVGGHPWRFQIADFRWVTKKIRVSGGQLHVEIIELPAFLVMFLMQAGFALVGNPACASAKRTRGIPGDEVSLIIRMGHLRGILLSAASLHVRRPWEELQPHWAVTARPLKPRMGLFYLVDKFFGILGLKGFMAARCRVTGNLAAFCFFSCSPNGFMEHDGNNPNGRRR